MKFRRPVTISIIIAATLLAIFLLAKPVAIKTASFLSRTEKADANILVIEGWLPYEDLKAAVGEFISGEYEYIISTGLKSTTDYYNINTDGFLIFYTGNFNSSPVRIIAVKARSQLGGENSAHFNLWVNDTVLADFNAGKRKHIYSVEWNGSHVDSVMIQFDNDLTGEFGDRNLYVREIIFNGKISIPFLNNSVYDISDLDNRNRIVNNMNSNSELTAKRLVAMGIDSSRVLAIPGNKVRINRTLTSALALRDWLKKTDLNVKGINIISSGTHSRRTWMTFRRVLDTSVNIGVIALPDRRNAGPDGVAYLKTLRETVAFLYYSLILIPY